MIRFLFFCIISAVCLGFYSCASQYPMLAEQTLAEAKKFKDCSEKKGLRTETYKADSLYNVSWKMIKKGLAKKGYPLMRVASTRYRIALFNNQIAESKKKISELERSLVETKEELNTYKKILTELKSIEIEEEL